MKNERWDGRADQFQLNGSVYQRVFVGPEGDRARESYREVLKQGGPGSVLYTKVNGTTMVVIDGEFFQRTGQAYPPVDWSRIE